MMGSGQVSIRFYGELNDFLLSTQRQRDRSFSFVVAPSVKDMVESFGVPHTEVDLILVNGVSVDFAHRLADGDQISVYPVFERLDIADITRVRPDPLRRMSFVADVHLGKLARRLRLLGFDTLFDPTSPDEALARTSTTEGRVLLTRDRGLLKRRSVTHGLFVRDDDPDEQVVDVVRRLQLTRAIRPFTRCLRCNGLLDPVAKERIADQLPPMTRENVDRFVRCRRCRQIYWRGAHRAGLEALVDRIRTEADEAV